MNNLAEERAALRRLAMGGAEPLGADVAPLIRRGTRYLLLALWALAIVACVVTAWVLISHARSHTRVTAVTLDQYVHRNVALAEFVTDEFAEFLDQRGGVAGLANDAAAVEKLSSLNKWLPEESVSLFVMPDGGVAVSTAPMPPAPVNLSDRRWFKAHTIDGLQTYVGPAIMGRVSKRFLYTYTAAYRDRSGQLLGVTDLGIPSDSITGLLAPGQHGVMLALVQHEGPVVAAQPFSNDMLGKPVALPATPAEGEQTLFGTLFGTWSVVTVRNIPDLGLYAVAALPLSSVLQPLLVGAVIGFGLLLLLTQLLLSMSRLVQQKSAQVEQALADNRVLFQEVHHRVKNNLQVVVSLLRLQIDRLPPDLRPLMEETSARVRAIALVHEQIYRTSTPSVVQLDQFLAQLVQQLAASMLGGTAAITTSLEPIAIPLDRAVPVAILATEAITNAIKHGLGEGAGTITVTLRGAGRTHLLEVRDSGAGPPEDGRTGLGTRILTALSRQIDGEWTIARSAEGGTLFTLSWPESSP